MKTGKIISTNRKRIIKKTISLFIAALFMLNNIEPVLSYNNVKSTLRPPASINNKLIDEALSSQEACKLCTENLPANEKGIPYRDFTLYMNPFPVSQKYHFVLASNNHSPQTVNRQDLIDAISLIRTMPQAAMIFNWQGYGASINNHKHFQGFFHHLPIEKKSVNWTVEQKGILAGRVEDWPLPAYVFSSEDIITLSSAVMDFIEYLRLNNIGINIYMAFIKGKPFIYVFPRHKCNKEHFDKGYGAPDFAGYITLTNKEDLDKLSNKSEQEAERYVEAALKSMEITEAETKKIETEFFKNNASFIKLSNAVPVKTNLSYIYPEAILDGGELLAIPIKAGARYNIDDNFPMKIHNSAIARNHDYSSREHRQEVIYLEKGKARIDIYDRKGNVLKTVILKAGDIITTFYGYRLTAETNIELCHIVQSDPKAVTKDIDEQIKVRNIDKGLDTPEIISEGKDIAALIIRADISPEKYTVVTGTSYPMGMGIKSPPAGETGKPHVHTPLESPKHELLIVAKGKARFTVYTKDGVKVKDVILEAGDKILSLAGHNVEFLEDTRMIEVAQGPYNIDDPKRFFKEISPKSIADLWQQQQDANFLNPDFVNSINVTKIGDYEIAYCPARFGYETKKPGVKASSSGTADEEIGQSNLLAEYNREMKKKRSTRPHDYRYNDRSIADKNRGFIFSNLGQKNNKFYEYGRAKPFHGLTTIAWVKEGSELYKKLCKLQEKLKDRIDTALVEVLGEKEAARFKSDGDTPVFSYLDPASFHMTTCDIDPCEQYNGPEEAGVKVGTEQLNKRLAQVTEAFEAIGRPGKISTYVEGVGLRGTITALVRFSSEEELEKVQAMEKVIKEKVGTAKQKTGTAARIFQGHISLGYLVNNPGPDAFQKIVEILAEEENTNLGEFVFDSIDLTYFPDMDHYIPILSKDLVSGETFFYKINYKTIASGIKSSSSGMLDIDNLELNLKARYLPGQKPTVGIHEQKAMTIADINAAESNIVMLEDSVRYADEQSLLHRLEIAKTLKGKVSRSNELEGFIDLHHHTFRSDGQYSPTWVVYNAWRKGMAAIGIVDHNTFEHIEEALKAGAIFGIEVIPGVEFDTSVTYNIADDEFKGEYVHVIGYFPFTGPYEKIEEFVARLKQSSLYSTTRERLLWNNSKHEIHRQRFNSSARAKEEGLEITMQDWADFIVGHPNWTQFGRILLEKYHDKFSGYTESNLAKEYGYKTLCDDGKPVFSADAVKIAKMKKGPEGTFGQGLPGLLTAIHTLGGTAILAHPIEERNIGTRTSGEPSETDLLDKKDYKDKLKESMKTGIVSDDVLPTIKEHVRAILFKGVEGGGFDGIEVYSSKHPTKAIDVFKEFVTELNNNQYQSKPLIITMGTDAHDNIYEEGPIHIGVGRIDENYPNGNLKELQRTLLTESYQGKTIADIKSSSAGKMVNISGSDAINRYSLFVELDKKIKGEGFFGPKVKANDRYEYVRLIMDDINLLDYSTAISPASKESIRNLPVSIKNSFAHVSKHILVDVLSQHASKLPSSRMPLVSDLDYMQDSPSLLLVAPFENKELKAGSFLAPPLGIYRLANYLRLFGFKVDIFDPNLKGGKEKGAETLRNFVEKQNAQGGYDFIGFSTYEPTLENDIELAKELKRISGDSIFIAGGEGAFYNSEKLLKHDSPFSVVYKGFSEFSMLDTLVLYMQSGRNGFYDTDETQKIDGTIVKFKNNKIVTMPPQPMTTKDDYKVISLFFDSTIVPYEDYWSYMETLYGNETEKASLHIDIDAVKTVRLITSSHCPMGCTFCSSTHFIEDSAGVKHHPVLSLTPHEIIEILKNIKRHQPGVRTVFFNDDDFMIYPRRVQELCDLIKEEPTINKLRFIALGRIDKVDRKLLQTMREAGFVQLNFGIESFSDSVLSDMNKKISKDKNITGLNLSLASGITPLINLILFYPTATKEDVLSDMQIAVEFAAKGAELSYWPFVEAFKGASIMGKVKSDSNQQGEYELSENGKDILPVDIELRNLALEAISYKDAVIQQIKSKYGIKGKAPHVVDVLSFFIAFYKIAGIPTDRIEDVVRDRLSGYVKQVKNIVIGDSRLSVIVSERVDPGLIIPQKPADLILGDEKLADKEFMKGSIGVLTVAGGMATRAALTYPKGLYPIMPVSGKTLFETRAEEIKAASDYYGKPVLWIIMTSDVTDVATRDYFRKNNYFDLGQENVIFVLTPAVPALLAGTQELAMRDMNTVLMTPGGHGTIYSAVKDYGMRSGGGMFGTLSALDEAGQRGIENFIYCQVDNAMPVIHRQVLGAHIREDSEFTVISVPKRDQEENLGMPVISKISGKRFYVEYNQPGGEALKRNENFDSGACGIFILKTGFLENIEEPSYHLVRNKKAKIYTDGKIQEGFIDKYERFMFDALAQAKKSLNVLLPREKSFATFKSMEGPDSPKGVGEVVSNYWKSIVREVLPELEIPESVIIELPRSSVYMPLEDLRNKLLALNLHDNLQEGSNVLVLDDFSSIILGNNVKPSSAGTLFADKELDDIKLITKLPNMVGAKSVVRHGNAQKAALNQLLTAA
jgi:UDP-N-acetylglucosamine pyrophosphorylase/radical SAM superfamily enzyme YgiQ (UPF0313 family)/uncharacterized protein YjlB